jgi:surface protein
MKRADDASALNSVEQRVMGILNSAADKVDLVAEQGWQAGLRLACRTAYHIDREDGDDMSTGQPVGIFDQVSQSVINMEDEPNDDLKIGTKKRSRSNRAKPGMKKKRSSSRPKRREDDIDELDEILGPTKPIDDASKLTDQKLSAEPEVSTSQPPVQKSEILGPKPIDDTSKLTDQKLSAEPEVSTSQPPVQKIKNAVVVGDRDNDNDDLEIATPAIDIDDEDKKANKPKSESFMKRVRRDLSTKANIISSIRSESTQVKESTKSTTVESGRDTPTTDIESGRGTPTTDIEDSASTYRPSRSSRWSLFNSSYSMSFTSKRSTLSSSSWWRQSWAKLLFFIIFVLVTICAMMAIVIGVMFMSQETDSSGPVCFGDNLELRAAAIRYVKEGCGVTANTCPELSKKYGWPLGSWCVSQVTDMSGLFQGLDTFDEDISQWEVEQVTDMAYMFYGASSFNQDISRWNVGKVESMAYMFYGASSFDSLISVWDTSSVRSMNSMFSGATLFNQAIAAWDTSSVEDMSNMFFNASAFNKNLCAWDSNFPFENANSIFDGSNCKFQNVPQREQGGPFCSSSCV